MSPRWVEPALPVVQPTQSLPGGAHLASGHRTSVQGWARVQHPRMRLARSRPACQCTLPGRLPLADLVAPPHPYAGAVAGGVTDCAGQAGDKVLCTSDTVRYGWCCTPERIRTQSCAYTERDTCSERSRGPVSFCFPLPCAHLAGAAFPANARASNWARARASIAPPCPAVRFARPTPPSPPRAVRRYMESCANMPDLMLCGCSDYISFCKEETCGESATEPGARVLRDALLLPGFVPPLQLRSAPACNKPRCAHRQTRVHAHLTSPPPPNTSPRMQRGRLPTAAARKKTPLASTASCRSSACAHRTPASTCPCLPRYDVAPASAVAPQSIESTPGCPFALA